MKHTTTRLLAAALTAALLLPCAQTVTMADDTRTVTVSTTEELLAALADARAGDEIIVKEGIYRNEEWIGDWSAFYANASGTAENPIILRSEDPEHPAHLQAGGDDDKLALRIIGSYWQIRDLIVSDAAKGIFLQQSEHSIISGCEVYNIGGEAIHIIDNSSYNLVENCYVHDAGTVTPQYGEGVYIGSSHKTEGYGYECHYNTVRGCTFGPNVAADHVDIKEYTIGNLVEYCTFDGTGIQGENGGDSFVEIKGNYCTVRNNIGYRNGCEKVLYAFDLNVQLDGWGQYNKIYDNTVHMDTTDCCITKSWNCSTMVFRNTATPEGITHSGNMTMQVLGFALPGDADENGTVDMEDVQTMQNLLVNRPCRYLSPENADMDVSGTLTAADLTLLKRLILSGTQQEPVMTVDFTKEEAGKWRMSDGLADRTLTFTLQGEAGCKVNMAWGYWNPNTVNESTGSTGKWHQIGLGEYTADENGRITIIVTTPAEDPVTRIALEIYDYYGADGSTSDMDLVELVSVQVQ
ncbi:MAG: hypothetical protein E7503_08170 [Ruminococcus sp.]|nr:hypothetical protein [Ruminococcus sp.]